MTTATATYLALDLETTGFDPTRDRILEIAIIVLDAQLQQMGAYTCPIIAPGQCFREMSEEVRAMHLGTGLLKMTELGPQHASYGKPLADTEEYLCKIADAFPEKPILAGSTVHSDRSFLRHWTPRFEAMLHHRHLDASTCKMLGVPEPAFVGVQHRALADANHSVSILRAARDMMGVRS